MGRRAERQRRALFPVSEMSHFMQYTWDDPYPWLGLESLEWSESLSDGHHDANFQLPALAFMFTLSRSAFAFFQRIITVVPESRGRIC